MPDMRSTFHQANEPDPENPDEVTFKETLSDVSGEHVAQVTHYNQDGEVVQVDRPIEDLEDALDESPSTEGKGKLKAAMHDTPRGKDATNPQPPDQVSTVLPEDKSDSKK